MPRPHKIQIVERKVPRPGKKDKILYYARVTYVVNQKRKAIWRSGVTKTEARDRLREALKERETLTIGGKFHPQTKFSTLMEWYLKSYVTAPTYRGDRKISGLRSGKTIKTNAKPLVDYFSDAAIGRIGHTDLETYKNERLGKPTVRNKGIRSIASVNRELALARRVFGIAEREGWILRSPFRKGDTLISQADERRGTRVLPTEEEKKLLEACTGKRKHLAAIIVCALDTGMRRGEILSLQWGDVDLETRRITLSALNTKTLRSRTLPISNRLYCELAWLFTHKDEDEPRVFGFGEVKRAFNAACKDAKLNRGTDGLSFRCLRRTAATRWLQAGIPRDLVSKLLGHSSDTQITYRHYLAVDENTLAQVEKILNGVTQVEPPSTVAR